MNEHTIGGLIFWVIVIGGLAIVKFLYDRQQTPGA